MHIIENQQDIFDDFIRLNEEWISHFFEIEEADRNLAKNPQKVIDDGGYIFGLVVAKEIVGVCALFNEGDGLYELARMAVSVNHQGKGYGEALIVASLNKLRALKAQKVYLLSNTQLEAAISLYKKHGFKTTSEEQHPVYSRANIAMELQL